MMGYNLPPPKPKAVGIDLGTTFSSIGGCLKTKFAEFNAEISRYLSVRYGSDGNHRRFAGQAQYSERRRILVSCFWGDYLHSVSNSIIRHLPNRFLIPLYITLAGQTEQY